MTSAVNVQMTMVSVNTSKMPKNPCFTGFLVSAHAWAMEPGTEAGLVGEDTSGYAAFHAGEEASDNAAGYCLRMEGTLKDMENTSGMRFA